MFYNFEQKKKSRSELTERLFGHEKDILSCLHLKSQGFGIFSAYFAGFREFMYIISQVACFHKLTSLFHYVLVLIPEAAQSVVF